MPLSRAVTATPVFGSRFRFAVGAVLLSLATTLAPTVAHGAQPPVPDRTDNSARVEAVIAAARSYLGVPYRLGTEGPQTVDCSGLVYRVFANAGELRQIGGNRLRAAGYLRWFAAHGLLTTEAEEAERGDLVIYANGKHIGIYLGDGRVISALVTGVTVHALDGLNLEPTGFLAVDWSGNRGPFKSDAPLLPTLLEEPEAPAALVPTADWIPEQPASDVARGPAVEGAERTDMRTAYSRTFAVGDGRFTTEVFSRPIHYQPDGSGDWEPIDLHFRAGHGTKEAAAISDASPVALALNQAGTHEPLIVAQSNQSSVALTPAGVVDGTAPLIAEDGSFADYHDLLGAGTGMRVLARADGFKTFLVLAKEPDASSFTFAIESTGFTPTAEIDGSVTLRDSTGAVVGRFARPLLLDSSDIEGDGGGVRSGVASVGVEQGDSGEARLVVTIERAALDEAVYPAYIDVSLIDFPGTAWSAGHTFASSAHPNGNFSTYQRPESPGYAELWHGRRPGSRDDNAAYLRFAGLAELLHGTNVESASLAAFAYWQDNAEPSSTWLGRVSSDWDPRTLTWETRPASIDEGTTHETTQGEWSAFDVSTYVRDLMNGATDYGLVLHANGAGRGHWKRFVAESSLGDGALEPRLVVTWSGLRPVTTPASSTDASSVELGWAEPGVAPAATRARVQISQDAFATVSSQFAVRSAAVDANGLSLPTDRLAPGTYAWRISTRYADGSWSDWSEPGSFTVAGPTFVL
jgi:hypothetical protein